MVEVVLGVDGRHAARARRGNRLPVNVILHVAAREDTRHAGVRALVGDDVAIGIHLELAPEERRVRRVPDRDEHAVDPQFASFAGDDVAQQHAGHEALGHVLNILDLAVPGEIDLRIFERLVLHDLRGAQRVAPMDDGHLRREFREERRFFHRRVSPADHHNRLLAEEKPVAGCARRYAVAEQLALGRQAQQPRSSAGRNNQRFGVQQVIAHLELERAPRQLHVGDVALDDLGAEALGLRAHLGHQLGSHDAVAEPRKILHHRRQHELTARLDALNQQRLEVRTRRVKSGRESSGAGPDDGDVPVWAHGVSFMRACRAVA